jgi:hypothetical protein
MTICSLAVKVAAAMWRRALLYRDTKVGIGYVLSLFEWNAVKNAVKKST